MERYTGDETSGVVLRVEDGMNSWFWLDLWFKSGIIVRKPQYSTGSLFKSLEVNMDKFIPESNRRYSVTSIIRC